MNRRAVRAFAAVIGMMLALLTAGDALARDASFMEPGSGGSGASEEAVKVEPKSEVDVGETVVGVAKRTSIFFVNQTNVPVKIEKVVVNSDSNVTAEATANDCVKQGVIDAGSRCSVEITVTAISPGPWSTDVLMTHNGAGRIARARLTGKTSGTAATDTKGSGLAVTGKEIKPIDFGDVGVGTGKTVRSTLMVNDSPEPITIYSIDVIEADNGLQRLDQGCAVDMELAPGASCPVTLLWVPRQPGPISTDLIIRHSGLLGFAVVPVRGSAKGVQAAPSDSQSQTVDSADKKSRIPPPPSAAELERAMAGVVQPVATSTLNGAAGGGGNVAGDSGKPAAPVSDGVLHLIGTVGNRALLLKSDGSTEVVGIEGAFEDGGRSGKVLAVHDRSADVTLDGKRKTLQLAASAALVARAERQAAEDRANAASGSKSGQGGGAGGAMSVIGGGP